MSRAEAVALMGATGTGKTELALELAAQLAPSLPLTVIACDSMQVYRGLDIGSAKPTREERARLPHEMLDICELPDTCSASRWAREAQAAIERVRAAGRLPLIVGGTGLYFRAWREGLAEIPPEDEAVREQVRARMEAEGPAGLHAELAKCDPGMAARLAPNDRQRIQRALSVWLSTGRSLREWWDRPAAEPRRCPLFVLDLPRDALRERIAARFAAMMEAGWLDEVRWLVGLGLPDSHPAMRAVGYRQLIAHVREGRDLEVCVRDGVTATRRYAKRQRTWFAHQTPDAETGDAARLGPLLRRALEQMARGRAQ